MTFKCPSCGFSCGHEHRVCPRCGKKASSPEVAWAIMYRRPPRIAWETRYFPTYPEARLEAERLKRGRYEVRIYPIFRGSSGEEMYAWCGICRKSVPITEIRFYEDGVMGKLACGHTFEFGYVPLPIVSSPPKGINPRWVLEIYPDEVPKWLELVDHLLVEHAPELTPKEESFLRSLRYYVETERKITIPMLAWLYSISMRIGVPPPPIPYLPPPKPVPMVR